MNSPEKDAMHLAAMLKYLRLASAFVDGMTFKEFEDDANVQVQLATAMAIAQVGEHVKGLSTEFRQQEDGVDWKAIAGTRDWLVHKYDDVDLSILYGSIVGDAPRIMDLIESVLMQDEADFAEVPSLSDMAIPLPGADDSES